MTDEQDYVALLEQIRWNGKPTCPYCGSTKATAYKQERRYHCNNCFTSYSVTVGTLFHKTHIEFKKWFLAIHIIFNSSKKISVRQLAQEIGVNKNTAAYMMQRISESSASQDYLLIKLLNFLQKGS